MRALVLFATLSWITATGQTQTPPQDPAPLYVESSIVNSASPVSGRLAPNTLATVYGQYLAHKAASISPADVRGGLLPTTLPGTGVRVLVGGIAAPLLYVSPGQINFIVPAQFRAGITDIRVQLDNRYGPGIRIALNDSAPALFGMDPEFAISVKATTGELLTFDNPGGSGDVITLYATGLGQTIPPIVSGELLQRPVPLSDSENFIVEIDGTVLPGSAVLYAGGAPGFAGVYQINVRLPDNFSANPTIRIGFASGSMSASGLKLHVVPAQPNH